MTDRLDELREMEKTIAREIAREQAQMMRMAQLRDVYHELLSKQTGPTAATIRTVAAEFELEVASLFGHDRSKAATGARYVLFAVLRGQALSYPEIGRIVGRDHTTVMYGCRKVDADPELAASVKVIAEKLANSRTVELVAS